MTLTQDFDNFETQEEAIAAHKADHKILHDKFKHLPEMKLPSTPADNLANFNAIVNEVKGINGNASGAFTIPDATYIFDSPVVLESLLGMQILGTGLKTLFVFNNLTAGSDLLTLADCNGIELANIQIVCQGQNIARSGLSVVNGAANVVSPSENEIRRIRVYAQNRIENGVWVGATDANNDFNIFNQLLLQDYTKNGFYMRNASQSYGNKMRDVRLYGGVTAEYGVLASNDHPGNFHWDGGLFSHHTLADLFLGSSRQPYHISHFASENSNALLHMYLSEYCSVELDHFQWSKNQAGDNPLPIYVNSFEATKHVSINHGVIGDSGGDRPLKLTFMGGTYVSMHQTTVYSNAEEVFTNEIPGQLFGCTQIVDEGNYTAIPLTN